MVRAMQIVVRYEGREAETLLAQLRQNSETIGAVSSDIAAYLRSIVEQGFEKQGRLTKWPPLSERYKQWKVKKKGTADPMLEFTGRLKQAINTSQRTGMKGFTVKIVSGVKYGVYHQIGTTKMPARPFMEYDEGQDNSVIVEIFQRHLLKGVR